MKKRQKERKQNKIQGNSGSGSDSSVRVSHQTRDQLILAPRPEDDPIHLLPRIMESVDYYFLKRGLTYLLDQRDMLEAAAEGVLTAAPGTVTAVPLAPGLGKSTLIRAILGVVSEEFLYDTPIARKLGGVIVVVEKTAEAYELAELCNASCEMPEIAVVLESPNDYNLSIGKCLNGTATRYEDCPRRQCPDAADCPLMQAAGRTQETPILILLHARYQRYLEDMTPFRTWLRGDEERVRHLLLVDELPSLIEEGVLNLTAINNMESAIDVKKPSYNFCFDQEKKDLLSAWMSTVRVPFFRLYRQIRKSFSLYGLVTPSDIENAGFDQEAIQKLTNRLETYFEDDRATQLLCSLQSHQAYYGVGQTLSVFFPRLRKLSDEHQPATVIFSGTAALSPELAENPEVHLIPDQMEESYARLTIHIQHGNAFSASKTALQKAANMEALITWAVSLLSDLSHRHEKILVVTYKEYAAILWERLKKFRHCLIPYTDNDGHQKALLPYFGGMNGSNLYAESTCIICLGLNRFEPRDYICRALAMDFDGSSTAAIQQMLEDPATGKQMDQFPAVMHMQNQILTRDLVQLVFRSALRRHGESVPVELWLFQPPGEVAAMMEAYFKDAVIHNIPDLPECCQQAVAVSRTYRNKKTHAAVLLEWLQTWDSPAEVTPDGIRAATGLTSAQFKEAKKNPSVRSYFTNYVEVSGSGKNTIYRRKPAANQISDHAA